MTGRRDADDDEPSESSAVGRFLIASVLVLAIAATAVLVLTDSTKWLRLGVLAALWAALLGGFLAARYRRQMRERASAAADLQSVYELELEREVAARREYELELEAEAQRKIEESSRADLAELRAELRTLCENLERLTGGEVLVERIALRAQSTRMRALPDGGTRVVAAGDVPETRRSLIAAPSAQSGAPHRPEPNRPSSQPRDRRDATVVVAPVDPASRRPQSRPRPDAVTQQPAARPSDGPQRPRPPVVRQTTASSQPQGVPASRPKQSVSPQPVSQPSDSRQPDSRQPVSRQSVSRQPVSQPSESKPSRETDARLALPRTVRAQPVRQPEHGEPAASATVEHAGGRRRAEDRAEAAVRSISGRPPVEPDGRRRDWQSYRESRQDHVEPSPDGPERAWETEPEPSGAHAAGRSVTELLAAHANLDDAPRRHRRRGG